MFAYCWFETCEQISVKYETKLNHIMQENQIEIFRLQTATILWQPQCVKHCFDSYQGPLSLTWNKYNLNIDACK